MSEAGGNLKDGYRWRKEGRGRGVFRGVNIAAESERQKHRQTEGISCHERPSRSRPFFCLSFWKGNTSQEMAGWAATAGETHGQN